MLSIEETIVKLQAIHDSFTENNEYRVPQECLDMFVEYSMIEGALHYINEQNKLLNKIAAIMKNSRLAAYPNEYLEIETLIIVTGRDCR